jgi:cobalamin biosynthesis Mg chelatase CobN
MKTAILSLAFAAGLVTAQLQEVPDCAVPCVNEYTNGNKIAECGQLDIKCICSNQEFLDGIACCLEDACDQEGRDQAVAFARQICSTEDVEVPEDVVCKRSSSSASEESSGTVAESTTATETPATETTSTGETSASETSSTPSPTTSGGDDASETDAPDGAAPGALNPAGGILGALIALMVAL